MKIYTIILLLIPLQIRKLLKIDPLFVPGKSSNRLSTISRTDPCKKNAWVAVGLFCKCIMNMSPTTYRVVRTLYVNRTGSLQIRKLLKIGPLFDPGKSSNRLSTISRTDPCKKIAWVAVGLFCKSIIYMKPNNVPGRTYIVRKPDRFDSTSDMGVAPINIHYTLQSPN